MKGASLKQPSAHFFMSVGITNVTPDETWITVTEWMQTTGPNPYDSTVCEKYGSDNSVFVARIFWDSPNHILTDIS